MMHKRHLVKWVIEYKARRLQKFELRTLQLFMTVHLFIFLVYLLAPSRSILHSVFNKFSYPISASFRSKKSSLLSNKTFNAAEKHISNMFSFTPTFSLQRFEVKPKT